jgi:hypothetical protein
MTLASQYDASRNFDHVLISVFQHDLSGDADRTAGDLHILLLLLLLLLIHDHC